MSSGPGLPTSGFDGSEPSDEQDERSSSQKNENFEEALENFRLKWQKELKTSSKQQTAVSNNNTGYGTNEEDQESKAKRLFLRGVELERSDKLYEAIQSYRRAVQLVPDIEFRLEELKRKPREHHEVAHLIAAETNEARAESDEDEDDIGDGSTTTFKRSLLQRIERKLNRSPYLCVPNTMSKEMHISALPPEIILYILRWVISSDLDVRSLEMFSQVCRGFYVCARDSEIWKSACERTWGLNCGHLSNNYASWREMFLDRAKLHFNGCYISKTTYIRHGESSFQDQFYRPWHLVAYYRYLRFFPEGIVLMLTTADEPSQCVGLLKNRYPRGTSVLTGHYRLKDDTVTIYVHRQEPRQMSYKRTRRKDGPHDGAEQTFHLELRIQSHNKRRHVQLVWTRYSVFTRTKAGAESNCTFELVGGRFPPLWFSRVKSYALESESPLV